MSTLLLTCRGLHGFLQAPSMVNVRSLEPVTPSRTFPWYEALPEGVKCKLCSPDDSRDSFSVFLHRLPASTETLVDRSMDPVVSMALDPAGVVEREVWGQRERAALSCDTITLTPAEVECRWRWNGSPLDILDIYIPCELVDRIAREHFHGVTVDVSIAPLLQLHAPSLSLLIRSVLAAMPLHERHATFMREMMTMHLIGSLLSLGRPAVSVRSQGGTGLSSAAMRRLEGYVQDKLQGAISLREMADLAHMSRFHFLRQFRQKTGMTPNVWVTRLRIERARRLLASSIMPITEVAALCGYPDAAYFATVFRRVAGVSPSQFRRSRN
mgnify:CR=1 FL=1